MKPYAQNYPQLIRELLALRWPSEPLAAVRCAYNTAERMTAGIHRPSGAPFIDHLVRTASIAARCRAEAPVVCTTLLHAYYSIGRANGFWVWLTRTVPRGRLRAMVGVEVEELVFTYHTLDWSGPMALEDYLRTHTGRTQLERTALMLRLANELEDLLDAGMCFHADGFPSTRAALSRLSARLAGAMDLPELSAQIEGAVHDAEKTPVPEPLRSGRHLAYRPAFKRFPESVALRERLRAWNRHYVARSTPK